MREDLRTLGGAQGGGEKLGSDYSLAASRNHGF